MFPAYFYLCKYISFYCNFCVTVCYKLHRIRKNGTEIFIPVSIGLPVIEKILGALTAV